MATEVPRVDIEALQADGWQPVEAGGFTGQAGPFFIRRENGVRVLGLPLGEQHRNNHIGTVHGGVYMTFADMALGLCAVDAVENKPCATASLQTQFVAGAKVGELLVGRAEVIRATKQLVFVRGLLLVGERVVASAEGVWKVLEPRA